MITVHAFNHIVYLKYMKIGLVGWGLETQSAYRFFGSEHEYVIVNEEPRNDFPNSPNITVQANPEERNPGLTSNANNLSYLDNIETCELIVVTPTAAKSLEKRFPRTDTIWNKTTSTIQLFFEHTPTKKIIGVTGTKGKGTTTTLIGKLLEAGGKRVHVGGNIGLPVLDMLPNIKPDDWVVLELSNFQLYHFPYSPAIAVHLMLIPEHISEWHIEIEDYVNAKANIFRHQTKEDIAIYLPTNEHSAASVQHSAGKKIPFTEDPGAHVRDGYITIEGHQIIATKDVGLLGEHNLENICAALTAAWQVYKDAALMREVIRTFTGLEHRLQHVRTLHGVAYYDDSFGTTPDTSVVAMNAFMQPKVMIVGGHDKGNDMRVLVKRLEHKDIRSIIGIGPIGLQIVTELTKKQIAATMHTKKDYNNWTMSEIVKLASDEAHPGDIVLLSAGTSSFGIFKDYKDRGNQFIEAVNSL